MEVLNARLGLLQDLLDALRDYTAHAHSSNVGWGLGCFGLV